MKAEISLMNDNVKNYVFSFFESLPNVDGKSWNSSTEGRLSCYYLEENLIDSFGFIEMIFRFENEFQIKFSTDDLQSESFRTVGGIIEILSQSIDLKKSIDS